MELFRAALNISITVMLAATINISVIQKVIAEPKVLDHPFFGNIWVLTDPDLKPQKKTRKTIEVEVIGDYFVTDIFEPEKKSLLPVREVLLLAFVQEEQLRETLTDVAEELGLEFVKEEQPEYAPSYEVWRYQKDHVSLAKQKKFEDHRITFTFLDVSGYFGKSATLMQLNRSYMFKERVSPLEVSLLADLIVRWKDTYWWGGCLTVQDSNLLTLLSYRFDTLGIEIAAARRPLLSHGRSPLSLWYQPVPYPRGQSHFHEMKRRLEELGLPSVRKPGPF